MASITSMVNGTSSLSSIYGYRNVLSGLASGMDTESMIENAVSGIKLKIQNLTKKRTKIEWQQEAYRSIIDKAVNFNTKYTSYSSKTNLLSSSFFNNAVNTVVKGTYADKISASGRTTSDVKINAVKQLAKAASYTVSGAGTAFGDVNGGITGEAFDITGEIPVSTVSGALTFQYGGTNGATFDIKFDELENLNDVVVYNDDGTVKEDAGESEKFLQAVKNKLSEVTYNYTKNGFQETTTADKAIKLELDATGRITFSDGLGSGNTVKISSSTGKIGDLAGKNVLTSPGKLTEDTSVKEYLADKELGITFNGTTKRIKMNDVLEGLGNGGNEEFVDALNRELGEAFGKGKIEALFEDGKLSLTSSGEGDTMSLGGSAVEALGFKSGDSNYVNTGKKLSELMNEDNFARVFSQENKLRGTFKNIDGKPIEKTSGSGETYYVDDAGNRVDKDGFRITVTGKNIYDFQINDAHINVTEDTTLESLVNSINSNTSAGVKVSYSKLTNEFKFTATESGSTSKIEFGGAAKSMFSAPQNQAISGESKFADVFGVDFGTDGRKEITIDVPGNVTTSFWVNADDTVQDVLDQLNDPSSFFGSSISINELTGELEVTKDGKSWDFTLREGKASDKDAPEIKVPSNSYASYSTGQDAVMDVEINGKRFENLTRSSNSFDIDGLTVNVKNTFEAVGKDGEDYEPITFETSTDSDKIVDAIREFVNDYNEMATELKNAYSTQPAYKNGTTRYEPLTAEQEEQYTESELKAYNEKAKQGILFGDSTLSSMYSKLLSAITPGGTDGQTLREIGIGTSYNNGMTTLSLDEDKLRNALESDPDKVKNAFSKTKEGGSATDGLMQTMQNTLNTYVKTTGEPKGVLIQRAGSTKAYTSLNNNSLKSQMDSIDNQIDRWTDKMASQIDRYTTQFSRLEQLIAQMNSQASAMSGLMGGSTGY